MPDAPACSICGFDLNAIAERPFVRGRNDSIQWTLFFCCGNPECTNLGQPTVGIEWPFDLAKVRYEDLDALGFLTIEKS